jgi:RHS repeat-associated protein
MACLAVALALPVAPLLGRAPTAVAAAVGENYSATVLADTPTSYWRLDDTGGSTATDAKGQNPGTIASSGVTTGVSGAIPNDAAMHFSGGDIALGTATTLQPNSLSAELWFNVDSNWTGSGTMFRWRTFGWQATIANGVPSANVFGVSGGNYVVTAPRSYADGAFHQLVVTKDGVNVTLYIDGAAVGSTPMGENTRYGTESVYNADTSGGFIGWDGNYQTDPAPFYGSLDEVALYGYAMSASQVNSHYVAATTTTPAPMAPWELYGGSNPSVPQACACHRYRQQPIDTATGNFFHTFDDVAIPGRGPALHFTHTYNSGTAATPSALGYGWTFPYNMSLSIGTNATPVFVNQENGSEVQFALSGGAYVASSEVAAKLVHNADGTYTFTRHAKEIFKFDSAGRLISQQDLNGYITTLGYNTAHQLTTITEDARSGGRTLTLSYGTSQVTLTDTASPTRSVVFKQDASGNLAEVDDVAGGRWLFSYVGSHLLQTMQDPRGEVVTNHYDASNRVDWQTDGLGRKTLFDYTSVPGSTKVTDPNNAITLDTYQAGLLSSQTVGYLSSQPQTWRYVYDPITLGVKTVTDPNLNTVTSTYDAQGNILTKSDMLTHTTSWTYDAINDVTTMKDPNGITTTYAYDTAGNLQSMSRPWRDQLGNTLGPDQLTSYGYDPTRPGDVTSITDPNTKVWHYGYDANGNLTSATDPIGDVTSYAYDGVGRRTSKVAPKGNVAGCSCSAQYTTAYQLNPFGDVTQTTDPLGHITKATFDGDRNMTSATDADGNLTSYAFDNANQLTTETRPDSSALTYAYDGDGNQTSVSQPAPLAASDDFNRPNGALAAAPTGQPWSVTLGSPTVDSNTFYSSTLAWAAATVNAGAIPNVSVKATLKTSATANSTQAYIPFRAIDANSYLYLWLDGTTSSNNVALYKKVSGVYTALATTSYSIGASKSYNIGVTVNNSTGVVTAAINGQPLLSYTLTASEMTTFGTPGGYGLGINAGAAAFQQVRWDDFSVSPIQATTSAYTNPAYPSAKTSSTDQLLRTTNYTYDAGGRLSTVKDPSLRTTTYGYDHADEVSSISYSDGVTPNVSSIGYDPDGQRTAMTDGSGSSAWTFDSLHRMLTSKNGAGQTLQYGFDPKGQLTSIMYPGPHTVTRTYWDNGVVHTVQDWLGHTTTFTPDADSNITTESLPNATTATQGFDQNDNLTSVAHAKGATNIVNFGYTRDAAGQLTQTDKTVGGVMKTEYDGYNSLKQLTAVGQIPSPSIPTYNYDGADNLTRLPSGASLGHDNANEPTTETMAGGGTALGYDTQGNRSSAKPAVGQSMAYGYDQANRLTSATSTGSYAAASGGWFHALVVRPDGSVSASGQDTYGQLGDGSTTNRTSPVSVLNLTGVVGVSAGSYSSLALKSDGTVWAWGLNSVGQLGVGTPDSVAHATAQQVPLSNVVAIAEGYAHSLAVKSDGTVWAWGYNSNGQLGDGTITNRSSPTQVPGLSGIVSVAAGYNYSLALRADGTVWAWGANASGQLGLGNNNTTEFHTPQQVAISGVTSIAPTGGSLFALARTSDGKAYAWGGNAEGELGNGSADANAHPTPAAIGNLSSVTAVVAGGKHGMALKSDGTVWTWGYNSYGELGNNGAPTNSNVPVAAAGLSGAVSIAAGAYSSYATKTDGSLVDWGYNADGEMGNGNTVNVNAPATVSAFSSGLPAKTATYAYNGDGLRTSKTANGTTNSFIWGAAEGMPLLLSDGPNSYIYDTSGIPLEQIDSSGNVLYLHHDQLGSTRALTDGSGNTAATFDFDAYGNQTLKTGTGTTPFGYAGQYTDAETGFQYLRARYYDPATAQWVTRDPLEALTHAPYDHVDNNPLNNVDPLGLSTCGLSLGGVIDCASKVGKVAKGAANSVVATGKVAGGLAGLGAADALGAATNFVNSHAGVSAIVCVGACIGISYSNGHVYLNYGLGDVVGASLGPSYSSITPKPCEGLPSHLRGFGPVTESTDHPGFTVGPWGPGLLVGNVDMYSKPVG